MYRRKEEMTTEERSRARDGEGSMFTTTLLTPEELAGSGRLFGRILLPVGASLGMHEHVGEYEIYYILSGSALVNDGEQEVLLGAGDVYLCRDGEQHSLANAGDVPMELLAAILYTKG